MEHPQVRARRDGDDERIAFVVRRAFGGEAEVNLVADLRAEGAMVCEFVAEREAAGLVGQIAFSRLEAHSPDKRIEAVALAPLAVLPTQQRRGVGRALVEYGLARLKEMNVDVAIVLGDPAFYSRFGFSALPARLLRAPYSGEGFQALELKPGVLGKRVWNVGYPAAFTNLT
jgi:putative acetyltransferase